MEILKVRDCSCIYHVSYLELLVVQQYPDELGHMGVDKTYDVIRQKYYMPNLYKRLCSYIEGCVICQTRSNKRTQPPLQETDIQPFPMAKVGLDLSGPYPTSLTGNKYIFLSLTFTLDDRKLSPFLTSQLTI